MSPAASLEVQAEVTQDQVLSEFARVMHQWAFRPFTHPLDDGICGGVELPGPEELTVRAAEFEVLAAYAACR